MGRGLNSYRKIRKLCSGKECGVRCRKCALHLKGLVQVMDRQKERYEKVVNILEEKQLDAILVSNGYNMRYISGFSGATGYLYLSRNRKVVVTDSRYTIQAKEEAKDYEVLEVHGKYTDLIGGILHEEQARIVGFEGKDFLFYDYSKWQEALPDIQWIALEDELSDLRIIKTADELEKIKKAEAIGDKAFEKILNIIRPGITELEVAAYLEFYMKEAGAEGLSFDTIVASGINSSKPHAVPGTKKIENGDFVTMDFGCLYQGYCSDMTRTIVVGHASEKQREVYDTVLKAQLAALDYIKAGLTGREIDAVARNIISDAGYGECFGHGLGHSVGLFIHENPRLSPGENSVILENVTETVEPGIYIENFGGVRIEDLVVVTKDGCENFTHSPKELIEI